MANHETGTMGQHKKWHHISATHAKQKGRGRHELLLTQSARPPAPATACPAHPARPVPVVLICGAMLWRTRTRTMPRSLAAGGGKKAATTPYLRHRCPFNTKPAAKKRKEPVRPHPSCMASTPTCHTVLQHLLTLRLPLPPPPLRRPCPRHPVPVTTAATC